MLRLSSAVFVTLFAVVAMAAAHDSAVGPTTGNTVAVPERRQIPPGRQGVLDLLSQLESRYNAGDSKGLAACWTENGEFAGPAGARADGREAIEKTFAEGFAAQKGSKLIFHLLDMRLVNDGVALVDAAPEIKVAGPESQSGVDSATGDSRVVSLVLVKQAGHWSIENARETTLQTASQTDHLKELEWLVGDWMSDTSKAGVSLRSSCNWTANRSFLIRKFTVEDKGLLLRGGTEVIGWDPRAKRIRSWVFDIDGGVGENIWIRDGNRWLMKYSGTLADGGEVAAMNTIAKVDADTITLKSKDRVVNGERQADVPEATLKRQSETKPASKASKPTILPVQANQC
jgi:uncharacterized protein (TIGR02246 family)